MSLLYKNPVCLIKLSAASLLPFNARIANSVLTTPGDINPICIFCLILSLFSAISFRTPSVNART